MTSNVASESLLQILNLPPCLSLLSLVSILYRQLRT